MYTKPKKSLGQHYLKDENIARKIISEFKPQQNDNVLEIGPGEGVLTKYLIDARCKLNAVEIDKSSVNRLHVKFPSINLLNEDFIKTDLQKLYKKFGTQLRIIGNIPYNITSPIIFKLIDHKDIIYDAVLMIQHEVAKRIAAPSGKKDYGILSVIVQNFAEVKFCFKVSPNVFYPRPKVDSAVIHLFIKKEPTNDLYNKLFIQIVKAAFNNRRKMLCNSFKNSIFEPINFNSTGIDLTLRAEQLTLENFHNLTKFAFKHINLIKLKNPN